MSRRQRRRSPSSTSAPIGEKPRGTTHTDLPQFTGREHHLSKGPSCVERGVARPLERGRGGGERERAIVLPTWELARTQILTRADLGLSRKVPFPFVDFVWTLDVSADFARWGAFRRTSNSSTSARTGSSAHVRSVSRERESLDTRERDARARTDARHADSRGDSREETCTRSREAPFPTKTRKPTGPNGSPVFLLIRAPARCVRAFFFFSFGTREVRVPSSLSLSLSSRLY